MNHLRTPVDGNFSGLPIVRPDFKSAQYLSATTGAAVTSGELKAGTYIITPHVRIMLCIDKAEEAAIDANSIFLPAGIPYHTVVYDGERISALAIDEAGDVAFARLL